MRTPSSLLAVVAASITALASGRALAATNWTFTKSPGPWDRHGVAAPASDLDAMVFNLTVAGVAPTRVTRMAFMVTGTLQTAELANFELVFYPAGLASPGVVVGSNTGSGWAVGPTTSTVSIDLTAPIAVQGDIFTGVFALRVDVNGARSFFFQPQLQTVTIENDGVERYLVDTEDLPLPGDSFYVN